MKYTLLKNQYHVDDPVYLSSGIYKGITFPQYCYMGVRVDD